MYKYTIIASDSNSRDIKTAQLKVAAYVKAGAKPPVFKPTSFSARLSDNVLSGTEVTTLTTDGISNLMTTTTFQVVSPDILENHFCIDYNRVLYVQKAFDVDNLHGDNQEDAVDRIELTVEMTSGYQTSLATVRVTLMDENDNAPVFDKEGLTEVISVSEEAKGMIRIFFIYQEYAYLFI